MKRPALALLGALLAMPAVADGPAPHLCTVTDFIDDSRYPLDADAIARNRAMLITLTDEGDHVRVETQMPNEEVAALRLPVTERSATHLHAAAGTSPYLDSVDWLAGLPATGTLIHRTYEDDRTWLFACDH